MPDDSGSMISPKLLSHLLMTMAGVEPQNLVGALQYGKSLVRHPITTVSSTHVSPEGDAVMYSNPDLDSPAAAMGNFVQTGPGSASDPDVLKHEMRHVSQSDVLGPAYLPAAVVENFVKYGAGPLERDAMMTATPNSEMFRKKSSEYVEPALGEETGRDILSRLIEMARR